MVMFRESPNRYFGSYMGGTAQSSSVDSSNRGWFPDSSWGYSGSSNVQVTAFQQIRLTNFTFNVLTHSGNDFFLRLNQALSLTNIMEITGTGEINSGDLGNSAIAILGVLWCLDWDFVTKGVGTFTASYNVWGFIS